MLKVFKSPKSSLAALLMIAAVGLFWTGKITEEMLITILGLAGAGVGFAAKDFDKTGKQ